MRILEKYRRVKGCGLGIYCVIDHRNQYGRVWLSTVRALWETRLVIPLRRYREEIEVIPISLF